MSKLTNDSILLQYLQDGNVITTRTAPGLLGIADVRSHIRNLRNAGYKILDRKILGKNRNGNNVWYKEYRISEN